MGSYHRENLRQELMEKGIELIHEKGIQSLSLREVARRAGVSESAPYRHFKDKEDLLRAIQESICQQFCEELRDGIENQKEEDILLGMGKAYVRFFERHPFYYSFLFSNARLNLNLEDQDCYPPLLMLKKEVEKQYPTETEKDVCLITLQLWSLVHTLAYLLSQNPESGFTDSDLDSFLKGGILC